MWGEKPRASRNEQTTPKPKVRTVWPQSQTQEECWGDNLSLSALVRPRQRQDFGLGGHEETSRNGTAAVLRTV